MLIVPSTTPGTPTGAANEGAGTRFPTRFYTAQVTDGTEALDFTAKIYEYEGAHDLSYEAQDVAGIGSVLVDVLGDATVSDPSVQPGRRRVTVQFDSAEPTHTLGAIKTAIDAHPVASLLVDVAVTNAGYAAFVAPQQWFSGGSDGVFHEITASNLAAAFAAGLELKEGSTLAISFSSALARRESVEETGKHLVPAPSLVVFDADSAHTHNAVHLGRVVDNRFVFVNTGTPLYAGTAQTTISNNSEALRAALRNSDFPILDATYNAATHGSDIIGVNADDWTFLRGWPVLGSEPQNLTNVLDRIDESLTEMDWAGAVFVRSDINRGLVINPVKNDLGVYGAEYVGMDASGLSVLVPANNSVQSAIVGIDTEFSLLRDGVVVTALSKGTQRISTTPDAYPKLNPASDSLEDLLLAMYNRMLPHASLQDLIEASDIQRDGIALNGERRVQTLAIPCTAPGAQVDLDFTAGNWEAQVFSGAGLGWTLTADGRFVVTPYDRDVSVAGTERLLVRNARDLSHRAIISLPTTPSGDGITAIASDGFSLAVAYESKIVLYDLSVDPPVVDTTWATAGIHTHSSDTADHITSMHLVGRRLYYSAYGADGLAAVTAGHNAVILETDGFVAVSGTPLGGNALELQVYGGYVAIRTDFAGTNVGVFAQSGFSWDSVWESSAYLTWTSVFSMAMSDTVLAIAGANASATDIQVIFVDVRTGAVRSLYSATETARENISLAHAHGVFYVQSTPSITTESVYRTALRPSGRLVSGQLYDEATVLWREDFAGVAGTLWWRWVTDGLYLYALRVNTNPATDERIQVVSTGVGSSTWVVHSRESITQDAFPGAASMLSAVSTFHL
jgi:hypothetical protein